MFDEAKNVRMEKGEAADIFSHLPVIANKQQTKTVSWT